MDLQAIRNGRLRSQRLSRPASAGLVETLRWMVAIQAQDYPGGKWSLGLRSPGATNMQVEAALSQRQIVRSWVMRGTLHFVCREDLLWLLGLLGPGLVRGNQRRYQQLELSQADLQHSSQVILQALEKSGSLTRRDLFAVLEKKGISTQGQRGIFMLQRASLEGLICQSSVQSNNPTFITVDGFPARDLAREAALAECALRYFRSRGPATLADFIWWSGLSAAEARQAVGAAESQLDHDTLDGQTLWFSGNERAARRNPPALLLPGFDEFLLAYKDRRASLGEKALSQFANSNGILPGTIVVDGRVLGTWRRTFGKETLKVTLSPFEPLASVDEKECALAAERLGNFWGLPVEMQPAGIAP